MFFFLQEMEENTRNENKNNEFIFNFFDNIQFYILLFINIKYYIS